MKAENKLQAECYSWYNNTYCLKHHNPRGLMFSIPNELAGTNKIGMMQAKATGLLSGVSDTILILPTSELIFIEFKTEIGIQSDAQKEFESRVKEHGYRYELVRSVEQFKNLIEL
jgi:hypothetical protein